MPRLLPSWRTSSTVLDGPQAWFPTAGEPSAARDFWRGETGWLVTAVAEAAALLVDEGGGEGALAGEALCDSL